MSGVLRMVKSVYRAIVPVRIRSSRFVRRLKPRLLKHGWIYDSDFYDQRVEAPAARSAAGIADSVIATFSPSTVVDVGCGTGAILAEFQRRGCQVFGLEYSEQALQYCRERELEVERFDLENDTLGLDRSFDVAMSLEVAEHLPASVADRYVALLASLSDVLVFTAAPPGQGGTDHVNEQPPSYWIDKFQRHGLQWDQALTEQWKCQWQSRGDVQKWYYQNLLIVRRHA